MVRHEYEAANSGSKMKIKVIRTYILSESLLFDGQVIPINPEHSPIFVCKVNKSIALKTESLYLALRVKRVSNISHFSTLELRHKAKHGLISFLYRNRVHNP